MVRCTRRTAYQRAFSSLRSASASRYVAVGFWRLLVAPLSLGNQIHGAERVALFAVSGADTTGTCAAVARRVKFITLGFHLAARVTAAAPVSGIGHSVGAEREMEDKRWRQGVVGDACKG